MLRYHARRSGGVADATAVGQRGPVAVPRNHKVDQEAPSRGLFVSIGSPEVGLVPIFRFWDRRRPHEEQVARLAGAGGGRARL